MLQGRSQATASESRVKVKIDLTRASLKRSDAGEAGSWVKALRP